MYIICHYTAASPIMIIITPFNEIHVLCGGEHVLRRPSGQLNEYYTLGRVANHASSINKMMCELRSFIPICT
jgi:hypothetical protein